MRIIAGRWRGKRLQIPAGKDIRPTSDRARGALFNLLTHGRPAREGFSIGGARVLDAFAGTGAVGLEALSRGAAHVTFIENTPSNRAILRTNIEACGANYDCEVLAADALAPPTSQEACDLVFMDPPYGQELWRNSVDALIESGWINGNGIFCIELGRREPFEPPSGFELLDDRNYGAARITFLKRRI